MGSPEPFTLTYRIAMAVCVPIVGIWGRLAVEGLEVLPPSGPTLIVANHDSQTDPLAVGVAARKRRQIRALAKRALWDKPGLGRVLDGMGQIPIERAAGDAGALANAIEALRRGSCIGVFPE
ncbi:MAG: lysophospholipid acyltransferase family protein, partial [Solirubrobacterales bacterium]